MSLDDINGLRFFYAAGFFMWQAGRAGKEDIMAQAVQCEHVGP